MKIEFYYRFSKNTQTSNFMKICLVGAKLFHADRRTDGRMDRHDEPIVTFRNFTNAPNKTP